jgi:phosphoribosylglycinamide formyltransferase-1
LLPAFPGAHAVRDALEYGALQTGYTIHIATGRVDDARGGIIDQQTVPVLPEDDEDSLHERIKVLERLAYPQKFGDSWTNGI